MARKETRTRKQKEEAMKGYDNRRRWATFGSKTFSKIVGLNFITNSQEDENINNFSLENKIDIVQHSSCPDSNTSLISVMVF